MAKNREDSGVRWHHALLFHLARRVVGLFAWTLKVDVHGWDRVEAALASGRPLILATWHGNILSLAMVRLRIQLPLLVVMISRSRDGDLAAGAMRLFGILPVRGSSSRGGAQGVLQYRTRIRELEAQGTTGVGVHMLDGPRGPRHRSKPGIIALARHTDSLILPMLIGAAPRIRTRSWDRHAIPLPFGRLSFRFGEVIDPKKFPAAPGGIPGSGEPGESAAAGAIGGQLTTEYLDQRLRELTLSDDLIARDA